MYEKLFFTSKHNRVGDEKWKIEKTSKFSFKIKKFILN